MVMHIFRMLPKLASYSDSICCMLCFCSGGVKSFFHKKNGDGARNETDIPSNFVDKSKNRKCHTGTEQKKKGIILVV